LVERAVVVGLEANDDLLIDHGKNDPPDRKLVRAEPSGFVESVVRAERAFGLLLGT
jgi:hypothetical protein